MDKIFEVATVRLAKPKKPSEALTVEFKLDTDNKGAILASINGEVIAPTNEELIFLHDLNEGLSVLNARRTTLWYLLGEAISHILVELKHPTVEVTVKNSPDDRGEMVTFRSKNLSMHLAKFKFSSRISLLDAQNNVDYVFTQGKIQGPQNVYIDMDNGDIRYFYKRLIDIETLDKVIGVKKAENAEKRRQGIASRTKASPESKALREQARAKEKALAEARHNTLAASNEFGEI